jgi:uncharacterized damage-inducible protein DinB
MSDECFQNIRGMMDKLEEETKGKSMEEKESIFHRLSERYKTFLRQHPEMEEPVSIEHSLYGQLKINLSELVQHVVNHGTYHRGNITAMLRQLDNKGTPISVKPE